MECFQEAMTKDGLIGENPLGNETKLGYHRNDLGQKMNLAGGGTTSNTIQQRLSFEQGDTSLSA